VDVRDLVAGEVERGDLDDMLSPSLFGERRVIVIRAARTSPRTSPPSCSAASTAPVDEVHLVVVHAGGPRARRC
jgi:DNA polymerase-3 subunit delta